MTGLSGFTQIKNENRQGMILAEGRELRAERKQVGDEKDKRDFWDKKRMERR